MRVIEKMLGVRYVRVPGVKLWHPDAQAYAVHDARHGAPIATLYVDLFPREGKYNHAAVWSFRNGSLRLKRAPQAALVVNIDRNGLTLDDLETLASRVRPRRAQQPVGHAPRLAGRHQRAARLRRGAVADAGAVDLRPARAGA